MEAGEWEASLKEEKKRLSFIESGGDSLESQVASERSLKFKISKFEQEVSLLSQQNEWLTNELNSKSSEFSTFRSDKNKLVSSLQSELDLATSSLASAESTNKQLQSRLSDVQLLHVQTQSKLQDMQRGYLANEEELKHEMELQKRVIDSLKRADSEKSQKLQALADELSSVEASIDQRCGELEREISARDERVEELESALRLADSKTKEAVEKVRVADELLLRYGIVSSSEGADENASPAPLSKTAAMLGRLQKSGKTFTEIYTDFVRSQTEVSRLQLDNDQLRQSMKDIMEEVDYKTSEFEKALGTYDVILKTNEDLSAKVHELSEQLEKSNASLKEQRAELDQLLDDNTWLKHQNEDVSKQLQLTLMQVEELQGNVPAGPPLTDEDLSGDNMDAQGVISQRIVAFKNIEELQKRNAELLNVVRRLSEDKEELEYEERRVKYDELKSQYEKLLKDVHDLNEERRRSQITVQSLSSEREMYKKISEGSPIYRMRSDSPGMRDASPSPMGVNSFVANGHQDSIELASVRRQLSDVQNAFEIFKNETAQDTRMLKESLEKSDGERSSLKIKSVQLETQNSFYSERIAVFNSTIDQQSKEISDIRSRNLSLISNISRYEQRIKELQDEFSSLKTMYEQSQNQLHHIKAEKDLFKSTKQRFDEDRQMHIQERNQLHELIKSLQIMHSELVKKEEESKNLLLSEKRALETELNSIKVKLNQANADAKSFTSRKESELLAIKSKLDAQTEEYQVMREEFVNAKSAFASAQEKLALLEMTLKDKDEEVRQLRVNSTMQMIAKVTGSSAIGESQPPAVSGDIAMMQMELNEAKADAERCRKHAETYAEISRTAEENLAHNIAAYETFKAKSAEQLQQLEEENGQMREYVNEVNAKFQALDESVEVGRRELESENHRLLQEVTHLQSQVSDLQSSHGEMRNNQSALLEDLKRQRELAEEASTNYEMELMKHAKDIEQINSLKSQLSNVERIKKSSESKFASASQNLQSAQQSWESQKTMLESKIGEMETRASDLAKQNEILHSQLEALGLQLETLQKVSSGDDLVEAPEFNLPESDKVIQDLREVVRYLRREKETVSYEKDMHLQECKRLEQNLVRANSQLDDARQRVSELESKSAGHQVSDAEYSELKQKSMQVDMIMESNVTLRAELSSYKYRVNVCEKELSDLQQQVSSLRGQVLEKDAELEVRRAEISSVRDDNQKWKARTQQILEKYDKIDPVEHQNLKTQLAQLQESSSAQITELNKLLDERLANLKAAEEAAAKATEDAQAKIGRINEGWKIRSENMASRNKALVEELANAKSSESSSTLRLEELRAELMTLEKKVAEIESENASLKTRVASLNKSGVTWKGKHDDILKEFEAIKNSQVDNGVAGEELQALKADYEAKIADAMAKHESELQTVREKTEMRYKLQLQTTEAKLAKLEAANATTQVAITPPTAKAPIIPAAFSFLGPAKQQPSSSSLGFTFGAPRAAFSLTPATSVFTTSPAAAKIVEPDVSEAETVAEMVDTYKRTRDDIESDIVSKKPRTAAIIEGPVSTPAEIPVTNSDVAQIVEVSDVEESAGEDVDDEEFIPSENASSYDSIEEDQSAEVALEAEELAEPAADIETAVVKNLPAVPQAPQPPAVKSKLPIVAPEEVDIDYDGDEMDEDSASLEPAETLETAKPPVPPPAPAVAADEPVIVTSSGTRIAKITFDEKPADDISATTAKQAQKGRNLPRPARGGALATRAGGSTGVTRGRGRGVAAAVLGANRGRKKQQNPQ